jgi:hypothetical protein
MRPKTADHAKPFLEAAGATETISAASIAQFTHDGRRFVNRALVDGKRGDHDGSGPVR